MRESTGAERSPSESPDETTAGTTDVPSVAYDTDAFRDAATSLSTIESGVGEHGLMIVFQGGSRPDRQHAMAALTEHASPTVHQFQVTSLLGERRINTQNALRKAFDHAAEEDAVLYFENVDAMFSHVHAEGPDVDGEAAPTTVEYFLDRVDAYRGLVILCINDASHDSTIRQYTPPDLLVSFDKT